METYKLEIVGQSADLKLSPTKSKDTGVFIPSDLMSFLGWHTTSQVSFRIFKKDCVKSAVEILSHLPLYSSKSGRPIVHDDIISDWSDYSKMIERFFGSEDSRLYTGSPFSISETTNERNYLYKLEQEGFNVRKLFVAGKTIAHFSKDKNGNVTMRFETNFDQSSSTTDYTSESVLSVDQLPDHSNILTALPLQQIFYGAPGTGKSCKTNEITREYSDTIRTTFHPDSDYSTFVGAYKPTTTEECVYGLNGDKTICLKDVFGNPLKTSKIEYKFIKQAFLKAYIRAWQKMCVEDASSADPLTFTNNAMYTIVGVDKDKVTYQKEHTFPKKLVESEWDKIWSNGSFLMPTGPQSGKSIQHAISLWIYNIKGSATTKDDFSAGWDKLIEQLQKEEKVEVQKSKIYELFYNDDTESVKVSSYANAGRNAIKKCYDGNDHRDSVEGITNILKSYNLPSFEEAWAQLTEDVTKGKNTNIIVNNTIEEQFLVIEEINRGNCAQIFGDIFQLLDRTDNGYSQYPIEADQDIQNALLEDSPKDGLSFGSEGLQLSDGIIEEINEIYKDSADDIVGKICHGEVLVLPKNLHIWATMNTSDQSLFPIDSAFKRRWDWEYKPIVNHLEENWKIQIGGVDGVEYDWWTFLEEVNQIINTLTSSEDKKLGYFFAKAKGKVVDTNTLVNKVFFYLWNDVFKDYELSTIKTFPKITDTKDNKERPFAFGDFFNDKTGKIEEEVVKQFLDALMPKLTEITTETTDEKEE